MSSLSFPSLESLPPQESWQQFETSIFNPLGLKSQTYDVLDHAYILGDTSLVLDSSQELFEPALNEPLYWHPYPFPGQVVNDDEKKQLVINERVRYLHLISFYYRRYFSHPIIAHQSDTISVYLCHAFGWYPYGHLHDSLQRLFPVREMLADDRIRFAVSEHSSVIQFVDHLSVLAGRPIDPSHITVIRAKEIHHFPKLIVPYSPAFLTNFTRETYHWAVSAYLKRYVSRPHERINGIYLSRNHVVNGSRQVVNESEVIHFLRQHNFQILTGQEPLEQIVSAFYHAKAIVGPHGSLFVNTIFCQEDAVVLEYCPDNRVDHSFRNKYKLVRSYTQTLLPADSSYNIHIPINHLAEQLHQRGLI